MEGLGVDIEHLSWQAHQHMVLKMYLSCKNVDVPNQYLHEPYDIDVCHWENKHMPGLKYY